MPLFFAHRRDAPPPYSEEHPYPTHHEVDQDDSEHDIEQGPAENVPAAPKEGETEVHQPEPLAGTQAICVGILIICASVGVLITVLVCKRPEWWASHVQPAMRDQSFFTTMLVISWLFYLFLMYRSQVPIIFAQHVTSPGAGVVLSFVLGCFFLALLKGNAAKNEAAPAAASPQF